MFLAMITSVMLNLIFFIVSFYYAVDRGFDEDESWVAEHQSLKEVLVICLVI
jgi:hypothetical protein